jgi:HK97 family phage major capsid protein
MSDLHKDIEHITGAINAKQAELTAQILTKASTESITEVKSDLANLHAIALKQGEMLAKIENNTVSKEAELKDAVSNVMEMYKTKASELKTGSITKASFEGKMATKSTVTTTNFTGSDYWASKVPGIGEIPYRKQFLSPLFPQGSVGDGNGDMLLFADQATATRAANIVDACAAAYPNTSNVTWIKRALQIEKIGDSIKICKDTLMDFDFVESQVRNLLLTSVQQKVDQQILLGTGLSNQLVGIDSFALAFAAGTFATSIPNANIFDLVHVTGSLISIAGEGKYMANTILMNPADFTKLMSTKDANGNYIIPPFATENGRVINGVRVVESTLVPTNVAYVFDSTMGTVYNRKSLGLEVADQNEDDFNKDLLTFKAFQRLSFMVRNVDYSAFVKISDVAAAITAINQP